MSAFIPISFVLPILCLVLYLAIRQQMESERLEALIQRLTACAQQSGANISAIRRLKYGNRLFNSHGITRQLDRGLAQLERQHHYRTPHHVRSFNLKSNDEILTGLERRIAELEKRVANTKPEQSNAQTA